MSDCRPQLHMQLGELLRDEGHKIFTIKLANPQSINIAMHETID